MATLSSEPVAEPAARKIFGQAARRHSEHRRQLRWLAATSRCAYLHTVRQEDCVSIRFDVPNCGSCNGWRHGLQTTPCTHNPLLPRCVSQCASRCESHLTPSTAIAVSSLPKGTATSAYTAHSAQEKKYSSPCHAATATAQARGWVLGLPVVSVYTARQKNESPGFSATGFTWENHTFASAVQAAWGARLHALAPFEVHVRPAD